MKAVHRLMNFSNPYTATQRERKDNAQLLAERRRYREYRGSVCLDAWNSWKLREIRQFLNVPLPPGDSDRDLLARAKFQFERSIEDERLENEIKDGQDELTYALRELKEVAFAQGQELSWQNNRRGRYSR